MSSSCSLRSKNFDYGLWYFRVLMKGSTLFPKGNVGVVFLLYCTSLAEDYFENDLEVDLGVQNIIR